MPECPEWRIVFGGLAVFAIWIFAALPLLYGPSKQTPQIETKQQSKNGVGNQDRGNPSPPPQTSNNKSGNDGHHGSEEGTEFWPPLLGYRLKITDSLLALFTFGLFVATGFLYWATRDLVHSAEKTAERQLRAYVHIENAYVMNIDDREKRVVTIHFQNFGQTPASNMTFRVTEHVREWPLRTILDEDFPPDIRVGASELAEVVQHQIHGPVKIATILCQSSQSSQGGSSRGQ